MKLKLPQVHFAVNVAGLLTTIGSVAGFVLNHPSCVNALPGQDALAATAIAGAIATFLPTKQK